MEIFPSQQRGENDINLKITANDARGITPVRSMARRQYRRQYKTYSKRTANNASVVTLVRSMARRQYRRQYKTYGKRTANNASGLTGTDGGFVATLVALSINPTDHHLVAHFTATELE